MLQTKLRTVVKKDVSYLRKVKFLYLQKVKFCSSKSYLFFGDPTTKFLISWFLIKTCNTLVKAGLSIKFPIYTALLSNFLLLT